jgi:TAT (twin-arginine translocation) pathway signal sequence
VTVHKEVAVTEKKAKLSRRNFLLTVGAGGAATAAAIVTSKSSPTAKKSGDGKRATRGYHATEHVNNYYRTTKV